MISFRHNIVRVGLILLVHTQALGDVTLPKLISDGMVLQRNTPVKIWGWASPAENITVTFLGKQYHTTAGAAGQWAIKLVPMKAGGPFDLAVDGSNHVEVHNILIGEVWVCSGQSNMELPMERVKEKYRDVVSRANHEMIRQFTVPQRYNFKNEEADLPGGKWIPATQDHILKFSAVAYFFALDLYGKYHVPIGLVNASLGGSPAEAWMSEDALDSFPELLKEGQRFKDDALIREIESADQARSSAWYAKLNAGDIGLKKWSLEDTDDRDWKEMQLPGYWQEEDSGTIWFRKKIIVPASMSGKSGHLWMGRIVDADSVFLNGTFIGTTSYQYPPRRYQFPPALLRSGENTVAIRVINSSGRGGFVPDKPYFLAVGVDTISLEGTWKYKRGATIEALPSQTFIRWKPFGLFNAMVSPLVNYTIKGVIWYQGEANTIRADQYERLFPALISNWRNSWKLGDFPFLFVQLANFMEVKEEPSESSWATLRNAQRKTLATSKNTGMAVAIDVGEWNDIHPLDKQTIGKRLALQAQRIAYAQKEVVASGPLYQSMKITGSKIELTFYSTGNGLTSKNGPLKYFAVAGADRKFVWANATIRGKNKVVVWSEKITNPVFVRYAWADNPEGVNLYNKGGLPASPFEN